MKFDTEDPSLVSFHIEGLQSVLKKLITPKMYSSKTSDDDANDIIEGLHV